MGCKYVFLDVGSNIGVHARFLYEPYLYPDNRYKEVLKSTFGNSFTSITGPTNDDNDDNSYDTRRDFCVLSFEPNPVHRDHHQELAVAYAKQGWRYQNFYAAVGGGGTGDATSNDFLTFYKLDDGAHNDWGFSAANSYATERTVKVEVPVINLAQFINDQIGKSRRREDVRGISEKNIRRKLSKSVGGQQELQRPEVVAMKMDIEGSEYSVLYHLLEQRSFRYIDAMTLEFHRRFCPIETGSKTWSQKECIDFELAFPTIVSIEYGINASFLDDESYHEDISPLPKRR